ncbi:MAG TPA: M28 family peptidase [Candidatus Limnocylindrales bacterium]|nr:M28 family peptidase [Candidatus Limnocylindrales bacterium]
MRHRVATLLAVAALLVGACSPALPSGATPESPEGSGRSSPGASGAPAAAGELRDAVDVDAILADLGALERLTMAAGGSRPAGSDGEARVDDFVINQLQAAGLEATRSELVVPWFRQVGPGALEIHSPSAPTFEALADFKPLLFSPSGDVTGPVVALGFNPAPSPGTTTGLGCDAADWAGFPEGAIALVQPGACLSRTVIEHAQAAGAAAVVRSYPDWTRGHVLRPTLLDPAGLTIPVIGVTNAVGVALAKAAAERATVRIATATETTTRTAANLVFETRTGDRSRIVMLGAHLDSVIDGPGINDDGSGAMTVLEIGRRLAALTTHRPVTAPLVRVAFWTGEELGLDGSSAWLGALSGFNRQAIAAYLNFDMLGSPNGVREVAHWSAQGDPGAAGLEALFGRAFELEGLTWDFTAIASSDDLPFAEAGIPTGGLFAGHNTPKTAAQVARFGGVLGAPLDPCYHLACDTAANIDPVLLGEMARAAAWVTGYLASGGPTGP